MHFLAAFCVKNFTYKIATGDKEQNLQKLCMSTSNVMLWKLDSSDHIVSIGHLLLYNNQSA